MFNNQIYGKNHNNWFLGQIVDEINWQENINDKVHLKDDVSGWGYRYKIRIFGRDTQEKDTSDNQLEMAEVMLPVTGGSGHAGSAQTPNLRQGSWVCGFYKDGQDCTEPVITGTLFNNSQTLLFGGDPLFGFTSRSGYFGAEEIKSVATKNLITNFNTQFNSPPTIETAQQIAAIYHLDQRDDGSRCNYIPKTKQCDGPKGELKGIQRHIKNLLRLINKIKTNAKSFIGAASDLTNQISSLVNDATAAITALVKNIVDKLRSYVINKINNGIKDLINLVPPNLQAAVNGANEEAIDVLQCVFNKIIKRLFSFILDLLNQLIDKYINAPMCAVEDFIAKILNNILGDVTSAIDEVLSTINGLIGKASKFIGDIFDVLDIVTGFLQFLTCEEELDCSMTEEWSFWYGAKCFTDDLSENLRDKIKAIGIGTTDISEIPCNTGSIPCGPPKVIFDGLGSGAIGNPIISATGALLGIDFVNNGSGYNQDLNVQIVDDCGNGNGAVVYPRTTDYFVNAGLAITIRNTQAGIGTDAGGITTTQTGTNVNNQLGIGTNISGISTNQTGIGTNIINQPGTGTTIINIPTTQTGIGTNINDQIGAGTTIGIVTNGQPGTPTNSIFIPGIGTFNPGSIVDVVVIDPGVGFLPAPNGSTGGNGETFTKPNDTLYQDKDGNYSVFPPNTTIPVLPGDNVFLPPATNVQVYNNDGDLVGNLSGQGQTVPIGITTAGNITTPEYDSTQNTGSQPGSSGSYPVVLTIKDVVVTNPGVAYSSRDSIKITPDNGSVLTPIINDNGQLTGVNIVNPGIGFTDFPKIVLQSTTGVNARITPVFGVIRVGDLKEEDDLIPTGTPIINVVDCVGRTLMEVSIDSTEVNPVW